MKLWPPFHFRSHNPARELALIGGAKRHADAEARRQFAHELMLARARQLRRETNLPPDPRLEPKGATNHGTR